MEGGIFLIIKWYFNWELNRKKLEYILIDIVDYGDNIKYFDYLEEIIIFYFTVNWKLFMVLEICGNKESGFF